MHVITETAKLV